MTYTVGNDFHPAPGFSLLPFSNGSIEIDGNGWVTQKMRGSGVDYRHPLVHPVETDFYWSFGWFAVFHRTCLGADWKMR